MAHPKSFDPSTPTLARLESAMVRAVGIEPTLLSELDFESSASTSFTTPAALVDML
jgi:hypothetical protein